MTTETTQDGYNGWTNWHTWNSYNWISSDEHSYSRARMLVKATIDLDSFRSNILESGLINHDDIDPNKVNWDELWEALNE